MCAPQASTVHSTVCTPQASTVHSTVCTPQASTVHSVLSVLLRLVLFVCAMVHLNIVVHNSTSIPLYGNIEILTEFNLVLFLLFPVSSLV